MSNVILIRGGKIAFSCRAGYADSDEAHIVQDLNATVMAQGWFIPAVVHGPQVGYMLDPEQIYRPQDEERDHSGRVGTKGVMVMVKSAGKVTYHKVEVNDDRKTIMTPLYTGDNGFAVITPYDHLGDMMAMCVQLTDTIEKTMDMFHRYCPGDRSSVVIWDQKQAYDHVKKHHVPYIKSILERDAAEGRYK